MGIEFESPFAEELGEIARTNRGRLDLVLNKRRGESATLSHRRPGPRPIVGLAIPRDKITLGVAEGIDIPVELLQGKISIREVAAELHAFLAGCGITVTTIRLFDPPRPHHPAQLRAVVSIEHGLVTCRYPRGKTR